MRQKRMSVNTKSSLVRCNHYKLPKGKTIPGFTQENWHGDDLRSCQEANNKMISQNYINY
jgi:hypothetical protein